MQSFSSNEIQAIYNAVFRNSTKQPGFYYRDFGYQIDTKTFRQQMVYLKSELSKLCELQLNKQLNYQSLGRFDHQHSSKFHRDSTAESPSFLVLGYEPTKVDSKVYIADFTKYLEHKSLSLGEFFEDGHNVILDKNKRSNSYVTELFPFCNKSYRLLFLNNSESFGVFHSAEIARMIDGEDRVINYMMMYLSDLNIEEQCRYTSQDVVDFVNTDKIDH